MRKIEKITTTVISILLVILITMGIIFGYSSTNKIISYDFIDETVYDLSYSDVDDCSYDDCITKIESNNDGIFVSASNKIQKSAVTGIDFVSTQEEYVDANYYAQYNTSEQLVYFTTIVPELEYESQIEINFILDENYFDGSFEIDGVEFNIFDFDEEGNYYDGETTEECFVISLSVVSITALCAVLFGIGTTMVLYPEFYVNGITSLANGVSSGIKVVFDGLTYAFNKLENYMVNCIEQNRINNNKNIYYLAVPITKSNSSQYAGSSVGDLYLSSYPVTYAVAKTAVKKGYSIYSFEADDSYRVLKNAWVNSYVKEEPCDSGFAEGYYSHYHPYYKLFGKLYKRYVEVNNTKVSIHGFYGYPW